LKLAARRLLTYLPSGGLAPVERAAVWGVGRYQAGLQEHTAQRQGLQRGRTLVGEAQTHKHLEEQLVIMYITPLCLPQGYCG